MCHGQLVNEALYRAKKPGRCGKCDAEIPKRKRFYFGTSLGYDDGLLANFRLCMRCAALDDYDGEGIGCRMRDDDPNDPTLRERIAHGLAALRRRLAFTQTRRAAIRESRRGQ